MRMRGRTTWHSVGRPVDEDSTPSWSRIGVGRASILELYPVEAYLHREWSGWSQKG